MMDPRRELRRPSGVPCSLILLYLLSKWAVRSVSGDIRPSDHGLASEKSPVVSAPSMAAFFMGKSSDLARPEARNATDTVWSLAADAAPGGGSTGARDGSDRKRTVLITAGAVFAVVGVGLLVAAAFAYVKMQARRSKAAADRRNGGESGRVQIVQWALEPV